MPEVGIRELRADLSKWVKRVEAGEEIVITDRGKAVARIVPADGRTKLDQLIAEGRVKPAPDPSGWRPTRRVRVKGGMGDLVDEQRR